jgi:hypothetical protein
MNYGFSSDKIDGIVNDNVIRFCAYAYKPRRRERKKKKTISHVKLCERVMVVRV